jgi:hypothetical protein
MTSAAPSDARPWWRRLLRRPSTDAASQGAQGFSRASMLPTSAAATAMPEEDWADMGTGFGLEGSLSTDPSKHGWLRPE